MHKNLRTVVQFTMKKASPYFLMSLFSYLLYSPFSFSQCSLVANPIPIDVSCKGSNNGSVSANASGGSGLYAYVWSTTATTSSISNLVPGNYSVIVSDGSCLGSGVELVTNGSFSGGNVGFSSAYAYTTPPNTSASQYWVAAGSQVSSWNGGMYSNGDHTTGSGDLLIVNGSGTPSTNVWCQTIAVTPNTTYNFSTWVSSLNNSAPALLQFSINGITLGGILNAPATWGSWIQFFSVWNSGANTSANICILNQNTTLGGNDFGLDDISFQACTPCTTNANVTIIDPPELLITTVSSTNESCGGADGTATVSATGGTGSYTYLWSPSGQTTSTANALTAGNYSVTVSDVNGCNHDTTVIVNNPSGPTAVANSNSPVAIGSSINLSTDTVNGIVWSGPNGFTSILQNPIITNAQIINSGTYQVIKTNALGCKDTAETIVIVYQPEIPDNGIDDDGDGLIDCADPDLATLKQCYKCGYDSIAWKTVIPESGYNKGVAVKYTGYNQFYVVPVGVTSIKIKAWGAGGGGSNYNFENAGGGAGAYVEGLLVVNPGDVFSVMVGEGGACDGTTDNISYGFGGSYSSPDYGGFGGGLSGIFSGTAAISQTDQARALLIAGGGGGAERDVTHCASGGQGGDPTFGGGMTNMQGENGGAKIGGGGGGGYYGGITTLRLSSIGTFHAGEGGTNFVHSSVTSGLSLSSPDFGNWNAYPLMYKMPPNTIDPHYTPWVNQSNPGIGTGNMYVGSKAGNGLVVVEWYEPIDDLTITASKNSICTGDTLTLIASGQSNYLWSPAATLSGDTAKTVIASPSVDIIYQVISNFNNCKDTAQTQIIVHQLPNLTLSPDTSICLGDSLQISATGASTYNWFPSTGLNTASGTPVTASPIVTIQYFVTGTDNYNCSSTDSLKITVDSLPIALITGIAGICIGDSTVLTASGGVSYLWNNGTTSAAIKIAPALTTNYSVVVKNSNNCSDSTMITIIVHPLPIPQFSGTNVCDGNNVAFTNSSTINPSDTIQSYSWNFGDGSSLNNTQNPSYLFNHDSSYQVQLLVVSTFGCFDSLSKVVTVNPKPDLSFTANDTSGCTILCVSFQDLSSINTGNNSLWLWDFGDGSATSNSANPNHCYTNNAAPGSFSVSLTITSDSGCVSTLSKNNYITVHPKPTAMYATANVCEGTNVLFTDFSTIPATDNIQTYTWNFGDGSPVNTNQVVTGGHLYASPNSYTSNLVVVSNFGCRDSITKIITVNPKPNVSFNVTDTVGCGPLCTSFQNSSSILTGSNTQWVWVLGDGSSVNNSQVFDHCYTNDSVFSPTSFNVTLTVTSDSGCVNNLSKNNYITVYPNPDASFTVLPQTTTITDPVISVTNVSSGGNFWNWNFGDLQTSTAFNPSAHSYADTGKYTIVLIVSTLYNCIDSTYQTIIIEPDFMFYIPNAFTPDGDGINDSFTGKGVFVKDFEMSIFDRWGNLIFFSDDINKPWDGKANRGTEITEREVYIYSIKVTDYNTKKHNYKGIVTLVR